MRSVIETLLLLLLQIFMTAMELTELQDTCGIDLSKGSTICEVAINGSVCLICLSPREDASWSHDDKKIYRSNNAVGDKDTYEIGCHKGRYSLKIIGIGVQQAIYSCRINNIKYTFNVRPTAKPTIIIKKRNVEDKEGQMFDCTFLGLLSSVNLTWFINEEGRTEEVKANIDQLHNYTIPISGPFPKGASEISCKASGPRIITKAKNITVTVGFDDRHSGLVALYVTVPCFFLASILTSFILYYKAKNYRQRKLKERRQSRHLVDTANFSEQNYEGNGRVYSDITKKDDKPMTDLDNAVISSRSMKNNLVSRLKTSGSFEYWSGTYVTDCLEEEKCFVKTLSGHATMKDATTFQELAIQLKSLTNSNFIVRLLSVYVEEIPYSICYEYMECGSLRDFMLRRYQQARKSRMSLSIGNPEILPANVKTQIEELLTFATMIAEALKFITSQKLCHPSLSLKKVLLSEYCECKLYDIYPTEMAMTRINNLMKKDDPPIAWMAVETIFLQEYQTSSDVWSFAVLLWELFSLGDVPFARNTREEVEHKIREGVLLTQPLCCPGAIYGIMLSCWNNAARKRPTFESLLHKIKNMVEKFKGQERKLATVSEVPEMPYFVLDPNEERNNYI